MTDSILNHVDGFRASDAFNSDTLPFAAEAAWSTGKWGHLERMLSHPIGNANYTTKFNVGIGRALLALRGNEIGKFKQIIGSLRAAVANDLSPTATSSLHTCHDSLVKLHVLYEIEAISGTSTTSPIDRELVVQRLDQRLEVLGAYTSDKRYLLGVRRAVMQLSK